jgi:hypothetical protein
MNAAQQGTPADVTKFAYANLAPRLSLGVRRLSFSEENIAIESSPPNVSTTIQGLL